MDRRELEITLKLLARANPPPVLHRYRKPTERMLEEIVKQQIFASSPDGLNDPFEYFAPVFWNRDSALGQKCERLERWPEECCRFRRNPINAEALWSARRVPGPEGRVP